MTRPFFFSLPTATIPAPTLHKQGSTQQRAPTRRPTSTPASGTVSSASFPPHGSHTCIHSPASSHPHHSHHHHLHPRPPSPPPPQHSHRMALRRRQRPHQAQSSPRRVQLVMIMMTIQPAPPPATKKATSTTSSSSSRTRAPWRRCPSCRTRSTSSCTTSVSASNCFLLCMAWLVLPWLTPLLIIPPLPLTPPSSSPNTLGTPPYTHTHTHTTQPPSWPT
jgi:hypothetical protein